MSTAAIICCYAVIISIVYWLVRTLRRLSRVLFHLDQTLNRLLGLIVVLSPKIAPSSKHEDASCRPRT
jgi:hypothetical protein